MIARVIEGVKHALPQDQIIVATSNEASDDPLACYAQRLGVKVFRGPLEDVFNRFRLCLEAYPCDWFFRISADSPLLNGKIMTVMMTYIIPRLDLVTNVQKRTFPRGHSVELLNAVSFSRIDPARLSAEDCEHVTRFYYAHPEEFHILNLENVDSAYGKLNFAVDTLEDLRRVEEMVHTTRYDFAPEITITAEST